MVYPATSLHIKKYSKKDYCFVRETRDRYETIVRPHIEKNQLNPQWVYNIIDGKSEQDRIILQAENFILLPTWTWDGKIIESMHILALVKTRDIHSIRDLRAEHIPLLQSILKQTTVGIQFHSNGLFTSLLSGNNFVEIWCSFDEYPSIFSLSTIILSFTFAFYNSTE